MQNYSIRVSLCNAYFFAILGELGALRETRIFSSQIFNPSLQIPESSQLILHNLVTVSLPYEIAYLGSKLSLLRIFFFVLL
jgi:hypothetical protein